MVDLLKSLIVPPSARYSFREEEEATSEPVPSTPQALRASQALETSDLVIFDIDEYLQDTSAESLRDVPLSAFGSSANGGDMVKDELQSISVVTTTKTSVTNAANVNRFYQICQRKELKPIFSYESSEGLGAWGFKGRLSILGCKKIVMEHPVAKKKEAKCILAEIGYDVVGGIEGKSTRKSVTAALARTNARAGASRKKASQKIVRRGDDIIQRMETNVNTESVKEANPVNWIGKLLDFHNSCLDRNTLTPPKFTEVSQELPSGRAFSCTCVIAQSTQPFGFSTGLFGNKKAAKSAAAREAVSYLISRGFLGPNGEIFRSHGNDSSSPTSLANIAALTSLSLSDKSDEKEPFFSSVSRGRTPRIRNKYAQHVAQLCSLLGHPLPVYKLQAVDVHSAPNFFEAAAYLNLGSNLPVAEVRNIYGRKAAHEECAKLVYEYLCSLREKRAGDELKVGKEEELEGDEHWTK